MNYRQTAKELAGYREQIADLRRKMRAAQVVIEPEEVEDYVFQRAEGGTARLSDLFGTKSDLFVIHNMGRSCPACR